MGKGATCETGDYMDRIFLARRSIPETTVAYDVFAQVERRPRPLIGNGDKPWRVAVVSGSGVVGEWYAFRTKNEARTWLAENLDRLRAKQDCGERK